MLPDETARSSSYQLNNTLTGLTNNFTFMPATTPISKGALVCYKSKPAIIEAVSDKIDIAFFNTTKRVREKDIKPLHPGPVGDVSGYNLEPPDNLETLDETLELLDGEAVPLADLSELLFGDFSPANAWSTWAMVMDGLYFEGEPEAIRARPAEQINEDKAKRDARRQQQEKWSGLIERIKAGNIEPQDHAELTEVEQLACAEREGSRILNAVGLPETKEAAHTLLLKLGYWNETENPWPRRFGINRGDPELPINEALPTERRDFRHMQAWAIDDVGNQDPDDAISLDGDTLWVHVADASSIVTPDSVLDIEARSRGVNVYLPDRTIHMLPPGITQQLGLGLQNESPALSIGFRINEAGELSDLDICFSTVCVTRTTYQAADGELDSTFAELKAITDRYHARRVANNAAMLDLPEVNIRVNDGEITITPYGRDGSRQLVTEAMLAAGEAVALFAQQNNLPIPYAFQPEPEEIRQPQSLSEHYAYRRCFQASRHGTEPASHFGLGLPCYTRVTSPMRRYLDLIVHQQLRAFLTGQALLEHEPLVERIGQADEAALAARKAERQSNQHWTLLYLKQYKQQHGNWRGEAVVVMQEERKTAVILPDLALEPKLRKNDKLALDQSIQVEARSINLTDLRATFHVID